MARYGPRKKKGENISQSKEELLISDFVKQHPFTLVSNLSFTTSQRRAFLRDVYDFSRGLGLTKSDAEAAVNKARALCGDKHLAGDDSALENEIDDTKAVVATLARKAHISINDAGQREDSALQHDSVSNVMNAKPSKNGQVGGEREAAPDTPVTRSRAKNAKDDVNGLEAQTTGGQSVAERRDSTKFARKSSRATPKKRQHEGTSSHVDEEGVGAVDPPDEAPDQQAGALSKAGHGEKSNAAQGRKPSRKRLAKETITVNEAEDDDDEQPPKKRKKQAPGAPTERAPSKTKSKAVHDNQRVNGSPSADQCGGKEPSMPAADPGTSTRKKHRVPKTKQATEDDERRRSFLQEIRLQAVANGGLPGETGGVSSDPTDRGNGAANSELPPADSVATAGKGLRKSGSKRKKSKKQQEIESSNDPPKDESRRSNSTKARRKENNVKAKSAEMVPADWDVSSLPEAVVEEMSDATPTRPAPPLTKTVAPTRQEPPPLQRSADGADVDGVPKVTKDAATDIQHPTASVNDGPEFPVRAFNQSPHDGLGVQQTSRVRPQATPSPVKQLQGDAEMSSPYAASSSPSRRKSTTTTSQFFSQNPPSDISCMKFPPLKARYFGIVQEKLQNSPFKLLVAVMLLNKTRGSVACPVCDKLFEIYPTVRDLAQATVENIVKVIGGLGLQQRRAQMIIDLARTWIQSPPQRGKRYRLINYPNPGDGKNISKDEEPIAEEDPREAWEVVHLPSVGAYAVDSWRIFCRDTLRGRPHGLLPMGADGAAAIELNQEWTNCMPKDKELRAYLRWRWLRLGFLWDPVSGQKLPISRDIVARLERKEIKSYWGFTNPWLLDFMVTEEAPDYGISPPSPQAFNQQPSQGSVADPLAGWVPYTGDRILSHHPGRPEDDDAPELAWHLAASQSHLGATLTPVKLESPSPVGASHSSDG